MKKYTYTAYDWDRNPVELTVMAETRGEGWRKMIGILDNPVSREFINIDEGVYISDEVEQ